MNAENIKVMRNTVRYLRILGLFPGKEEINQPDKMVYVKFIGWILVCYLPVGATIHLLMSIKNSEFHFLAEDIMKLLGFFGIYYFTVQYLRSIKKVVVMHEHLSDFEIFGKPAKFDKFDQLFDRLCTIFFYFNFAGISGIMLGPVFFDGKCKEETFKEGINEMCGMVSRMWLPFDYDFFPVKQIVIVYQYLAGTFFAQGSVMISFSMFGSIQHINYRFQHLCDTFMDILRIRDPTERRKQFGKAVQYHYVLIKLGNTMNEIFGPCAILHVILTAPVLGTSGYRLVTSPSVDSFSFFVSWTLNTCLVCISGQGLQDSSENLSNIIYQTEWYNLEKELQRDLRLVIMRSQRPTYMKAGIFGNVTYTLLLAIGKASYSYLTLFQQKLLS